MLYDCVIHLIDRTAVRDLELLIALILAGVTADTDIYARGNLGGGDADDIIAGSPARSRVEIVMDANGMKMR